MWKDSARIVLNFQEKEVLIVEVLSKIWEVMDEFVLEPSNS